MKFKWSENKIFKEKFIVLGNWNFDNFANFSRCDFISADTETKLYYKNKLLTEEDAYDLYKYYGANWCRQNIHVKAYAFTISDGENFALFQNIEDFLLCCATMLVKKVFWYNAKFDFALFDYFFASNFWQSSEDLIKGRNKHKLPDKTYQSLNGDFGQRYKLRIWKSYKNKHWQVKVHNFEMLDICNIFGGGLRKNLQDWNIIDKSGKEVRKLTMDYVNSTIENDLEYMIADTKGLHLLAIKINEEVEKISGFSLFKGDYITAGGLAKKSLLKFMFKQTKNSDNLLIFRGFFPMTVEEDLEFRNNKLYQGGKCLINPYKRNKILKNIYKYDINSMYPTQMRNMKYPVGKGRIVKKIDKSKYIYVFKIKNIYGTLKENMVPVWYDIVSSDYVNVINEQETHYFWLEELEELERYYNLEYSIVQILEFDAKYCKGAQEYVDNYYKIKKEGSGTIRNGAKLFLNSAYGKLAERIETVKCEYKMSEEGYMHLVKGETKIDKNKMMSVLLGSRITALARTSLMNYIRKICKDNPKKYFVYCDTDSVHALCEFKDTDDKELGKMKSEGIYEFGKYIAPKTYMLYNNLEENDKEYEIHCKGVNVNVVKEEIKKCKSFEDASEKFKSGVNYRCLSSLNCIGGKALIYIDKMLLNPKLEKKVLEDDELMD